MCPAGGPRTSILQPGPGTNSPRGKGLSTLLQSLSKRRPSSANRQRPDGAREARERSRDVRYTASPGARCRGAPLPSSRARSPGSLTSYGSVSPARTIPFPASPLALLRGARRGGLVPARGPRVPAGRRLENHCSRGETDRTRDVSSRLQWLSMGQGAGGRPPLLPAGALR